MATATTGFFGRETKSVAAYTGTRPTNPFGL